ncbi:ornithine cyclodeaminase [Variovorax sp. J22R133]|uniref:ornithine cyclodeaminase n=1 Tax=Variovorax brevis TaxID=3053503 RepID=UPI002574ECE8|nr:ornithine cyclodeaminase [Variovorax sp. J22R133]MDM0115535.1 ornithine cyclodeaminase [Variovorax sp. J22R133]
MTRYVDIHDMKHLIQQLGVQRMCREMEACIREDFLRWEDFQKSARTANHSTGGVIELMPVSDQKLYAFKYVNGHPGNPSVKMSTVMAFGVLADVATGYPMLLSELTMTTALRTAATSVMAAAALARPDSRSMALIGNGAQSEFQALAFMDRLNIRELRLFDVDPHATDKLMRNLTPQIRSGALQVRRCASVHEAVRGADIVTTVTADKTYATILTADLLEPGMHLNAVGGDCPGKTELEAEILRRAKVFVEYEPQTRVEGDLQQMPADFAVTALWEVLAGRVAGRESAQQVTLFDSVGFALEDLSALRYVHRLALAHGVGSDIDLVPSMDDPKDLFGYSLQCAQPVRKAA